MNKLIITTLLAMSIGGCSKDDDASKKVPAAGFQETKLLCTQCHAIPHPSQYHPAAWPSIVAKMERYMIENNQRTPSPMEREAILSYLQSGWNK